MALQRCPIIVARMPPTHGTAPSPRPLSSRDRFHAVTAGYLGWTMDAFDFFVVVFLVDTLALHFGVPKKDIVWSITITLALRPVGAVIFGLLADRYGRRVPLMANLLFFSTVEVLCGFAPNYATFLILRALFGIGMGGEWGVGASLAMESAPPRWRGILSGILQSGYSTGYLLAAVAARLVLPAWGWRAMFWIGGVPALLAFYIRWHVPESEAWRQKRAASVAAIAGVVRRFAPRLAYLVALMTMMMFLSHGTQDLYPDFLKIAHGIAPKTVADVADPLQRRRDRRAPSSSATSRSARDGAARWPARSGCVCWSCRSGRSAARCRCSRREPSSCRWACRAPGASSRRT